MRWFCKRAGEGSKIRRARSGLVGIGLHAAPGHLAAEAEGSRGQDVFLENPAAGVKVVFAGAYAA